MTTARPTELPADLAALEQRFAGCLGAPARVAVAFSGGVDSSVTLALTARQVGATQALAVLGVSPSLAASERAQAHGTAKVIGVTCHEVSTFELDDPDYVANRGDRCYFCKRELYTRAFASGLAALDYDLLINGDTADDLVDPDRPGRLAAIELGVRSPLAEAGIGKAQVRAVAKALALPVWDKPSAPCLASRIPVNTPVNRSRLGQVERAEAGLSELGWRNVRVRHHGRVARVELGPEEFAEAQHNTIRSRAAGVLADAGYADIVWADVPLDRS